MLCTSILPGCWDLREINHLGIVSTAAFDKEGNQIVVTVELFRSDTGAKSGAQHSSGLGRASLIAQGQGLTISWAIRDLARKVSRRVYWPHTQAVIVGEELAREGLTEILDVWNREVELRRSALLLIAKGKAMDVLIKVNSGLESSISEDIKGLEASAPFNGYITISSLHDVIRFSEAGNGTAITGVIELASTKQPPNEPSGSGQSEAQTEAKMVQVSGLAVLVDGKLKGIHMASAQTRGILMILNKVTSTMINIECPCAKSDVEQPIHYTAVKATSIKSKIEATKSQGMNPEAIIFVTVSANLSGQQCSSDLTDDETIKLIEHRTGEQIKAEIAEAIVKAQQVPCDPFGFANAFHKKDPQTWAAIDDKWESAFAQMRIEIEVEVRLSQIGVVKSHPAGAMKQR